MKKSTKVNLHFGILGVFVFAVISYFPQYSQVWAQGILSQSDTALDARIDGSLEAEVEADSKTNVDNTKGATSSEAEERSTTTNTLRVNPDGITITSSSQVETEDDLKIFSANLSTEDESVDRVDIKSQDNGESEVKVVYKHKGKLLGFIPVTLKSSTVVETKSDSEPEVKAEMPWWSFLVTNENFPADEIESNLKSNSTVRANAVVYASAEAKAKVAEAVLAEVESSVNASAKVNN